MKDRLALVCKQAFGSTGQVDDLKRLSALERIAIDQPGYAGLQKAKRQWCK